MQAIRVDPARPRAAWSFWQIAPWAAGFACLLLALGFAAGHSKMRAELQRANQRIVLAQKEQESLQQQLQSSREAERNLPASGTAAEKVAMPSIGGITAAEEARLRAQLDRARQRVELNEADNFALQHQLEQLRSDLAAATNHAASLEKDLASEQAQEKGKERIATRPNADAATALAAQLERSQAEVRRLSAAAGNGSKIERLLESPSLQQIFLRSVVPQAGGATARALYSPQGGLLLIADSLPALPDQKCYQVWLIRKSAPAITSAGLMTLQAGGKGILFAPPSSELAEVTALAITDEPAGGSVSSRGKKLLFGAQ